MTTVRFDAATEITLKRLAAQRGQTVSDVLRDAVAHLAEEETRPTTAYQRLRPFVGIVDSGGRQLSRQTGRRLRDLLAEKRRARGAG